MNEGTRYRTILHPTKKVSEPDGYEGQEDGKIKAEPAAGVWGCGFAWFSEPAASYPDWLLSEEFPHFRRAQSQPPIRTATAHERR